MKLMDFKSVKHWLLCITYGLIFFFFLYRFSDVLGIISTTLAILFPFLLGCFLAFILNLPMKAIEAKIPDSIQRWSLQKWKRPVSLVLTLLLFSAVLYVTASMIIPALAETIQILAGAVPSFIDSMIDFINEYNISNGFLDDILEEVTAQLQNLDSELMSFIRNLSTGVISSTIGFVSSLVSFLTTFIIAVVFAIYILLSKERLLCQIKMLLFAHCSDRFAKRTIRIGRLVQHTFSSFFSGQFIEACILGAMFIICMTIFRIPYALLIGVVIALTALVPIFGAFIGCIIGIFLIMIESPMKAVFFLVMFLILQQIEGNLIYPKVVGTSVGLPAIWVLAAVSIGGSLFGIAGMLFFIPVFSVVYNLLREHTWKQLRRKKIPEKNWKP